MPLLVLFLLIAGTGSAWARPTIYGEGLPGLNPSGASNWDNNTKEMSAYGEANTYYAEFLNVAASSDSKYRFKIAVNNGGNWWDGAMCGLQSGNYNNVSQSKGNVEIVEGKSGDNQISFKMPFDGDVYIFYKSTNADNSKVWIVAVPKNVAAAPNNSGTRKLKTDIILKDNEDAWTSDGIKFAKNNDATTYKHVTSYIMPAKKSTETGAAIRFEMCYGSTPDVYISGKSDGRPAALSSLTPRRIIYLWDGNNHNNNTDNNNVGWISYTLPTYPMRKSGWKLFVKDYNSGNPTTMDANGSATLTLNGGSSYEFFIANTEDATNLTTYSTSAAATYPAVHSVNWFGGCYVDKSNSSNVTFNDIQVYKSDKLGTLTHPVVDSRHLQGKFQVSGSGAKDVTFSFDGGKITINAVDHVESFTDEVYVYGAGGTNWVTGWSKPVEDYKMIISGGVASKTFYNVKGNGLNFKVWNKTTSSDIDWSKYDSSQSDVTCTNCSSNNICFDLAQNSDVTVYTDGEKVWVKVQARQTITSDYYLQGDYNGWHTWTDAFKFTKVDNYTQRITKRWSPSDFTTCAGLSRCKILRSDNDWGNAITINGIHAETSSYTRQTDCEGGDTRICVKLTQTSDVTYTIWKNSNGDKKVSINVVPVVVRTVTFNTDGGSSIDNANVENGQTVTRPSDPSKGGYAFVNWYSDSEKTVLYDFGTPVTADITLYAKWEAAETRRITFVTNGGTAVDPVDLTKGTKLSSYPSTSYGNGTVTWCTDEGLTTAFDKDNTNINEDITLYAKWGVSGNFYIGGDMWMHEKNGNNWAYYSTMAMTTTDGVASVTYIAPKGRNRFEILTTRSNWTTIPNQESGLIASSTPELSWAKFGPDNNNHFVFDLDAPKKVTIRYNGKVSITAEDYDVVKTGWTVVSPTLFGNGSDDNADYADNGAFMSGYNVTEGQMNENGERVFRNVNPGTYKFWIGKYNTNLDKTKQQIEVFGAANVDKAYSSLSGYGSLADNNNAHINRNIPQDDKLHRRVTFTLTQKADIKIAFDGGKIKVNVLPTHTVTFNSNGGSEVASQSVFEGNVASDPGAPSRPGYTFQGWKLNDNAYNFSSAVTGNITLVAAWVEAYTVTFDLNGGGDAIEQTVAKNTAIAALDPEPTRDGYTFRGWTLNSSAYDFSTLVTQNITLVANWVENHTITFNSKGGSAVAALIVPADETGTAPSAPTRYGYSFNYWTLNDVEYNFTTLVTEDITLVAEWTDDPSVPGVGYDGTEYIFMHRNQMSFSDGINTTDATCWIEFATADESHRSATQYAAFACDDNTLASLAPAGKWQKVRVCRTGETTFNTTYGTSGWLNLDSKEKNYIKTNIGGWETYAFVDSRFFVATPQDINNPAGNWNWNGNGTLHTGSYTMTLAASTPYIFKLTRDYRKAKQEVHWSAQGNYTHYNTSLSNLSNTECTELSNNQIQIQLDRKAEVTISWPNYGDIIITKVPYYNVTFKNGETLISTVEVLSGNTVSAPANQIKEGYRFTGWDWNFEDPITEDKIINAQFIQQVTVSFIANGETYAPQQTIDINTIITAPDGTPAKEGYRFTGWDWDFSNPITEDKTITAQFVEQVTVTFMANGAMFAERTIDKGDKVTALEEPTAPAKAFDGWWTDAEGGTQIDIVNQIFNAHTTLYAHWVDDPTYLQQLVDATDEGGELTLTDDFTICDLVINKTLTINGNGHSIGNLKVENEGDLTLSGALTVNDFTICAKAGNTTTPAASGQVRNATNLTVNGEAYFLYTVDPSGHVQYGWYDFTVPFRVNVMTGIKGIQEGVLNEDFVNERDYAVMEHLGEKQAAGEYAYKKFRGVMEPCRLYSITLDPQNNYNTIRFQKADGDLVADNSVTLNSYSSAVDNKHANWNGVGNGTLHHADAGLSVAIQVYQSGNKTFLPVSPTAYSLVIGSAFMVQQTGTMTLNQATHDKLLAPRRAASVQPTAIQIASEGQPFSDQLFISADEMAGQGYTQGADVAKAGNIGNVNVPQIWTNAYNSKLCAHEAQLINGEASYTLSLYAPANGSYTLTSKNIPEGYTLYLTQNGNRIWDLSERYVLDLTKGTATEYGLLLVERYNAPTAVENIGSKADETQKIMHNGILYILRNGKVFNAQGARVK